MRPLNHLERLAIKQFAKLPHPALDSYRIVRDFDQGLSMLMDPPKDCSMSFNSAALSKLAHTLADAEACLTAESMQAIHKQILLEADLAAEIAQSADGNLITCLEARARVLTHFLEGGSFGEVELSSGEPT